MSRPCSNHEHQVWLTPARSAASSRRSPGARRLPPAGRSTARVDRAAARGQELPELAACSGGHGDDLLGGGTGTGIGAVSPPGPTGPSIAS